MGHCKIISVSFFPKLEIVTSINLYIPFIYNLINVIINVIERTHIFI